MPTTTSEPESDASSEKKKKRSILVTPGPLVRFERDELRARLDPIAFHVTQERGTEKAGVNKYVHHFGSGTYMCAVCSVALFSSEHKYDARSGWPAFFDTMTSETIRTRPDASAVGANLLRIIKEPGLVRTEALCANCFAHLGHIFDDGPPPTGKRYCVNSASLEFVASEEELSTELPHLVFPARLQGCGSNGLCTRPRSPSRTAALNQRLEAYQAKTEESYDPKRRQPLII